MFALSFCFRLSMSTFLFLCSPCKPKGKRFTTAKAPQNMTINIEELMSPSEDENEGEEDEWRPEKVEKGRRISKKPKATGVTLELGLRTYNSNSLNTKKNH